MRTLLSRWFGGTEAPETSDLATQRLSSHDRKLAAPIAALRMLPTTVVQELELANVRTVGELLNLNLREFSRSRKLSNRHLIRLRDVRRSVRLALAIRGLRPREAYLLIAVHRCRPVDLATESPRRLFRDLQRFALSSRGARIVKRMQLPTADRVESWIASARQQT